MTRMKREPREIIYSFLKKQSLNNCHPLGQRELIFIDSCCFVDETLSQEGIKTVGYQVIEDEIRRYLDDDRDPDRNSRSKQYQDLMADEVEAMRSGRSQSTKDSQRLLFRTARFSVAGPRRCETKGFLRGFSQFDAPPRKMQKALAVTFRWRSNGTIRPSKVGHD